MAAAAKIGPKPDPGEREHVGVLHAETVFRRLRFRLAAFASKRPRFGIFDHFNRALFGGARPLARPLGAAPRRSCRRLCADEIGLLPAASEAAVTCMVM
jgi:hypothetical protein